MTALRIGDPLDPATEVGPLVTAEHAASVLGHIQRARDDGAVVRCGGGRPGHLSKGFFVEPTVLTEVHPDMPIAGEEVFGPVLSILTYRDEREAVAIANGVEYGLTAAVWTRDLTRAHRLASELDAGYVWLNATSQHFPGLPYGGVKSSGIGREESLDELIGFTQVKSVTVSGGRGF
jgi:2-formylbenzoate dehydrogenase